MKLAIMQPYFFPYIGYYQAICAVDKYILYDNLNYIKYGWMNRNKYLVINREPSYFIVPIKQKSSYKTISDIELAKDQGWRRKLLNAIILNYKQSPHFADIFPLVEGVINSNCSRLTELNSRSVKDIATYLDISTFIETDVAQYNDIEDNLRKSDAEVADHFSNIALTPLDRKVIRIIAICNRESANVFINAIGGQELYHKEDFSRHNIRLHFIKSEDLIYPQRSSVFYPNLSIIDVLMNCGKSKTKEFLKHYTLI